MSEEQADGLTRQDQLDLEAYKTLNANIDGDAHIGMMFERLLIPLIVAAPVISIRFPEVGDEAIIGGFFLIGFLLLRVIRNETRVKVRFDIIRGIERKLGFRAHLEVNKQLQESWLKFFRDYHIKLIFFVLAAAYYVKLIFD